VSNEKTWFQGMAYTRNHEHIEYDGSRTSVKVNGVLSEDFTVKVSVHHESILSPLLLTMVLKSTVE